MSAPPSRTPPARGGGAASASPLPSRERAGKGGARLDVTVLGISVWGPGLEGWEASHPILAGDAPYEPRASPAPAPAILAPTERRRAGPVVRLALEVARAAAAASNVEPSGLRCVFASSNGDGVVVGSILDTLAKARPGERLVSPTQFHNSVHNAAAGYWSIANGTRQPATCLGAHDSTWAAALLKAVVEVATEGQPVLLCCYDHPLPAPLDILRPTDHPFGVGLVLGIPSGEGPRLRVAFGPDAPSPFGHLDPALDTLMRSNTSARSLPLLAALARGGPSSHTIPYLDGHLEIELLA